MKHLFYALITFLLSPLALYAERHLVMRLDQYGIPSLDELNAYNVNRPGQVEAVKSSLYDFQEYAVGGQTQLQFFQVPKGQAGKTFADSNMTLAGSLPAPMSFLVECIEIFFFPLNAVSISSAVAPAVALENWNDVYDVGKSGWLELFIGSKPYLDEAPLLKFPPRSGITGAGASGVATTVAAATNAVSLDYASFGGPLYEMIPPILLVPSQNFIVTLNWPAAIPISVAGRIGINLGGILYRNSQ